MTTTYNFQIAILGADTVDDPVRLSSPTASYGVIDADNPTTTLVANNTAMTPSGSLWTYSFTNASADLVYRYWVKAVCDEITYYVKHTTNLVPSAALVIGRYTNSVRITNRYTEDSVFKWLDADKSDEPTEFGLRMWQLMEDAAGFIDDELRGALVIGDTVPAKITEIADILSAVRMYRAHGFDDGDEKGRNRLSHDEEWAMNELKRIKMNLVRLDSDDRIKYPVVVTDD